MKVCSKCNTQVNDDLQFCPNCGNSLEVAPQGNINTQGVQQDMIESQPVQPAQPTQPMVEAPVANKTNYKLIISILAGVVVICTIIAVIFGLKLFDSKGSNSNENNEPNTPATTPKEDKNVVTYGGFDFTIPEGYKKIDTENGNLFITDDSTLTLSLAIAKGSFEESVKYFVSKFKANESDVVREIDGDKYVWMLVPISENDPNKVARAFCYEYGDGYLFTGAVGTMTITDPGEDGFNLLKTLVSSAKKNSSFSGGDNEEALLEDNINKSLENIVQ